MALKFRQVLLIKNILQDKSANLYNDLLGTVMTTEYFARKPRILSLESMVMTLANI